jgi:hypothetical protein
MADFLQMISRFFRRFYNSYTILFKKKLLPVLKSKKCREISISPLPYVTIANLNLTLFRRPIYFFRDFKLQMSNNFLPSVKIQNGG